MFFCFVYNNALCASFAMVELQNARVGAVFGGVSGRIKNTFL